ncbi:hypothetical protein BACCOPRO_03869 [Phocaeicola coprophilus DSM 18228 = JCM 13818]|uniref:RHS repeat protein n=1 Tax=Phocaeicola coprophilus DSM 18228 = JCM 13818 TaxID=547042 RepID=S0FE03_9BACT|nr:hypothetical protein BACCOPRO_03869 [Phocaeicola coprophilus DSM 18228 = JCM 13818]
MGYNSVGSMTWREEAGNRVSFRYDGMDRLREVVNEAGAGYVFRRDLAGNISSEKDYGGIERIYHRDGCGRVTRIDRPGGAQHRLHIRHHGTRAHSRVPRRHERGIRLRQERADGHRRQR